MSAGDAVADGLAVTLGDIEAAARRLAGHAVRTPLLSVPALDERAGTRVFVKAECLQRTGSFKFRGAYNRLSMLSQEALEKGVVACSSGNHAQGVAEAARLLGSRATIVMPHDAPALKRARTERSGANVVGYDRESEDREAIAAQIARDTGATMVHPFDDPGVIAGQGTVGLEVVQELTGAAPRVVVCASGGGLMAGIAIAVRAAHPDAAIHPAEPEGFDDVTRSIAAGQRVSNEASAGSIADALLVKTPGVLTFAVHRALAEPGYALSDAALLRAMAFAAGELKLVLEPGGAAALAAVLEGLVPADRPIVVVASGGNADPATLARALTM